MSVSENVHIRWHILTLRIMLARWSLRKADELLSQMQLIVARGIMVRGQTRMPFFYST